jgi:hypothetical protein
MSMDVSNDKKSQPESSKIFSQDLTVVNQASDLASSVPNNLLTVIDRYCPLTRNLFTSFHQSSKKT